MVYFMRLFPLAEVKIMHLFPLTYLTFGEIDFIYLEYIEVIYTRVNPKR